MRRGARTFPVARRRPSREVPRQWASRTGRWGFLAPGLLLLTIFAATAVVAAEPAGTPPRSNAGASEPRSLGVEVVAVHPHDPGAYTQGLLWHEGQVYESTGRWGESSARRYRLGDAAPAEVRPLDDSLFGEGLAVVGDELLQLTWQAGLLLRWDLETLELRREQRYQGEGWGLAYDGERLYQSDGSHVLHLRTTDTFEVTGQIEVRSAGLAVHQLNELEWAEGRLYANVYFKDEIVRIDPSTGVVEAVIDASGLLSDVEREGVDVLNGIAYRPETKTFLLTGKYWPKIFEVRFVERP